MSDMADAISYAMRLGPKLTLPPAGAIDIVHSDLPWSPAAKFQAQDRTRRISTKPPIVNTDLALLDQIMSLDPKLHHFQRSALSPRFDPDRRDDRFNFVQATTEAFKRWSDYLDVGMVITEPHRHDPGFLDDWIFGPNGEFTPFGRIKALNDLARHIPDDPRGLGYYGGQRGRAKKVGSRELSGIYFLVEPLRDGRASLRSPSLFVRFASYDDYARFASLAARDSSEFRYHG